MPRAAMTAYQHQKSHCVSEAKELDQSQGATRTRKMRAACLRALLYEGKRRSLNQNAGLAMLRNKTVRRGEDWAPCSPCWAKAVMLSNDDLTNLPT